MYEITTNLDQVIEQIRRWPIAFTNEVMADARALQQTGAEAIRKAAPVRTGQLRNAFKGWTELGGSGVRVYFTVSDPLVARYRMVSLGTPAHSIVPVRAKVLAWGGGVRSRSGKSTYVDRRPGPVFRARVNHPGTRPNPFAERALGALDSTAYWQRAATRFASQTQLG